MLGKQHTGSFRNTKTILRSQLVLDIVKGGTSLLLSHAEVVSLVVPRICGSSIYKIGQLPLTYNQKL